MRAYIAGDDEQTLGIRRGLRQLQAGVRHWYVNGELPVAETEKLADPPSHTVTLDGCEVTAGGVRTVRTAGLDVSESHTLVATTS